MRATHANITRVCFAAALAVSAGACTPAWRDGAWNGYGPMGPMMWGSPFMGAFGILGTFLAVLAALFVFRWLTGGNDRSLSALDQLKARYAKGEITSEDYARMRKEIAEP
ncbi:MAG: SHOCT domain-containing protein [Hyphomonadaceae bacterium]|nr:SHOCT domain-containing protein [Hyphomonadaceae bacterium]